MMKRAIVVFTKVPKAGEVKTRLTEARGGILTPEESNALYEACLLDVINASLTIENAEVWICYNKAGNRPYLDQLLTKLECPEKIAGFFPDEGGSFDDCMQFAVDYMLKEKDGARRAEGILIVGGDLPSMQPGILSDSFAKMERMSASRAGKAAALDQHNPVPVGAALVEGACQEGGFSIVGMTCSTPFDFYHVFYNTQGMMALDMLVNKAESRQIPFAVVEEVPDIDIPVDLASSMPVLRALELAARYDAGVKIPKNTLNFLRDTGLEAVAIPPVREAVQ